MFRREVLKDNRYLEMNLCQEREMLLEVLL